MLNKVYQDYATCIQQLNKASEDYAKGKYGESSRHLGTNPITPRGEQGYDTISEGYVQPYSSKETIPEEILKMF